MIIDMLLITVLFGLLKVSAPLSIKEKVHGALFHHEMSSYLQIKKTPRFPQQHIWKGVGRSSTIWASRSTTRTLNPAFCTVYEFISPWTLDRTIRRRYNFYCRGIVLVLLSLSVRPVLDLARSKAFQFVSTYIILGLWKKRSVFL